MEKIDLGKLFDAYREVFPTPNDLVEYLKYDGTDDGEFLTIGTDYTCFNDIYEKYGDDDFDDDDDFKILFLMKIELERLNYKVNIDNCNTLSAILND